MSRDPYAGSIWDPASLHRYNYGRANPENYVDPSGRANLTDYALQVTNRLASLVVVTAIGEQVKCYYGAIGAMIAIVAESPFMTKEQAQILGAEIDPSVGACWAKVTYQQFAQDALLNLIIPPAIDYISGVLSDGLQGLGWRLLTEEEGSLRLGGDGEGPIGPSRTSKFLSGKPTEIPLNGSPENVRGLLRENETAQIMADNEYYVEQNPNVPGPKNPDYGIEGETCDCYSPSTSNVQNIWSNMSEKVSGGQANNLVVNLADSTVPPAQLQTYLANNPIPGMQSLFIIDQFGNVIVYP